MKLGLLNLAKLEMEFTREFNLLHTALCLADKQADGGLSNYCRPQEVEDQPLVILKSTISELLDGTDHRPSDAEKERSKHTIVSSLVSQHYPVKCPEDEAETKHPFVGIFPEFSTGFLFDVIRSCQLEAALMKIFSEIKEPSTTSKLQSDLIGYVTLNPGKASLHFLFRTMYPFLEGSISGPVAWQLFDRIKDNVSYIWKSANLEKDENLQFYLSLACLLEKCITLADSGTVIKRNPSIDALYTELQCMHLSWNENFLKKYQITKGHSEFLLELMNKGHFEFSCNLDLEEMKSLCVELPGEANVYTVSKILKSVTAALQAQPVMREKSNSLHCSEQLVENLGKLSKSWDTILLADTAKVFQGDILSNAQLVLEQNLPGKKQVFIKLLAVQDSSILCDPRWIKIVGKYYNILTSVNDFKILLSQHSHVQKHNVTLAKHLLSFMKLIFHKLPLAAKDEVINFVITSNHKVSLGPEDFESYATRVFNRLSTTETSLSDEAWLAMCNADKFVRFAIQNVIKHGGQGKIIVRLLTSLPSVCRHENLLLKVLKETVDIRFNEKEERNFVQFVSHLLLSNEKSKKSVLNLKNFVTEVLFPRVNVSSIEPNGLSFASVMDILEATLDRSDFTVLFTENVCTPFLLCLLSILDHCSTIWTCGQKGANLIIAKEKTLNCFMKMTSDSKFVLEDSERLWLEHSTVNFTDGVKYLMQSCIMETGLESIGKEFAELLCSLRQNSVDKRLQTLRKLIEIAMAVEQQEFQKALVEFSSLEFKNSVNYSELVLVLATVLPHKLSKEWSRCLSFLAFLLREGLLEHSVDSCPEVATSHMLLDVLQIIATSLKDDACYPMMMSHVAKCYASSIKELTNTDFNLGTMVKILSHVCLAMSILTPQTSEPLLPLTLDITQLIQEHVIKATDNHNIKQDLVPVFNVLHNMDRDDANLLQKKLKMFLKLYT